MRFVLDDRQQEFRAAARAFFDGNFPLDAAVARADDGGDGVSWQSTVAQLGVNALLVPEYLGGIGASFLDLAMVIEEAGRALVGLPLTSAVAMAMPVLLEAVRRSPDGPAAALLTRLGETPDRAVVVGGETRSSLELDGSDSAGFALRGTVGPVLDAPDAHVVLAFATAEGRPGLYAVEVDQPGVVVSTLRTLDRTRRFGRISLDGAAATWVAEDPDEDLRALARAAGRTALALDAAGGARRCLQIAVDYAQQRDQFGRPIGSFQAIKHKCADMLLKVESATSAAEAAAWTLAQPDESAEARLVAATLAKAYAGDAYCWVAGELIQVLGGIGFTWEHPAHLFFTRAKASAMLLGTPDELRAEETCRLVSTQ